MLNAYISDLLDAMRDLKEYTRDGVDLINEDVQDRWKLHSKRVKMKTTLETSEDENYTRNE